MFLRRCERKKNGKRHTYWALVESYRTAQGSRQRVVAHLGELKSGEETGWAKLASIWKGGRPRGGRSFRSSIRHRQNHAPQNRWRCG